MVFGQNLKYQDDKNVDEKEESDEESEAIAYSPMTPGVQRLSTCHNYVFPSRRTIMRYLQDASYLSLEYVAQ